jgi:hypothetical protein
MRDGVLDTTVVARANCDLGTRKRGNALDSRARLLESCLQGILRIRYNPKLLKEYTDHVCKYRNDLIEAFFAILDSPRAFFVKRNALTRQNYDLACKCRWPSHDQHLIAAALGGICPCIFVTEAALHQCAEKVNQVFGVRVELV